MRKERTERLLHEHQTGSWSTMSTEYFQLVGILFQRSSQIGAGERSLWVYAGLPLLVAGIEAFLIEHQRLFTSTRRSGPLAGIEPLMDVVKSYNLPIPLVQAIADLVEVRHEIIHPATPPFNPENYPEYVKRLQEMQLLDSHTAQSGAEVLSLLASHRLFEWGIDKCGELLHAVAASDPERSRMFAGLADNLREAVDISRRLEETE